MSTPKKKKAVPKSKGRSQSDKKEKKRRDWEVNNELIGDAFFEYIFKYKKFPTYEGLGRTLKLDEKTIRRHLNEDAMFEDLKVKMRALKSKALITLGIKAMKGDSHHWTRLFFEVTDEVGSKDRSVIININGKRAAGY